MKPTLISSASSSSFVVSNHELYDQGGVASSGGNALELSKADAFIAQEFESHEPPLQRPPEVLPDDQPVLDPLAVEFARCPYTISECGQFEIIGDRRIR